MNDEDAGLIKRGPKKGSAQEVIPLIWQDLLGELAADVIAQAHIDADKFRRGELTD